MRCGAASAELEVSVGWPLEGYTRAANCAGVLDELSTTAIAFSTRDDLTSLLLTVDAIGPSVRESSYVRDHVALATGVPASRIMICYSHTHAAPDTMATPFLDEMARACAQASRRAVRDLRPALAGWGEVNVDAAVNRQSTRPDGSSLMATNEHRPVDPRLAVLRLVDTDANAIAVVLRYTAHANCLRADNLLASGDWPSHTRSLLRAAIGCPVAFVNGCAGDVNPRWRGDALAMRRMAATVAEGAVRALGSVSPEPAQASIEGRTLLLPLLAIPDAHRREAIAEEATARWGVNADAWLATLAGRDGETVVVETELQALLVGRRALVGLPLEPFASLALDAQVANGPGVYLGGYTNGWAGYLGTAADLEEGGYEMRWAPVAHGATTGWLMPFDPTCAEVVLSSVRSLVAAADRPELRSPE